MKTNLVASLSYVIFLLAAKVTSQDCPAFWVSDNGNQTSSCYLITNKIQKTFADARKFCIGMGGDLLIINSWQERDWVDGKVLTYKKSYPTNTEWWIGLVDSGMQTAQAWVDGSGFTQTFLPWYGQEPAQYNRSKKCVVTYNNTLRHENCDSNQYFICERARSIGLLCDARALWEGINGKCYNVITSALSWDAARAACEYWGADLMVIEDDATEQTLYDLIESRQSDMWIGLRAKPTVIGYAFKWEGLGNKDLDVVHASWTMDIHTTQNALGIAVSSNGTSSCVIANHTSGERNNWQMEDCGIRAFSICQKPSGDQGPSVFPIRLVNGARPSQGRLEVYYHNIWGTVCGDNFDSNAALVVCRMLGYTGYVFAARYAATYGQGVDPIWLDDVTCNGTESSFYNCRHNNWNVTNCQHNEDVGVDCSPNLDAQVTLRLADGPTGNVGRVEVFYNNTWGTICDDGWNEPAARIVCNSLGNVKSIAVPLALAVYGNGTGPIWLDDVVCTGREAGLGACQHKPWGVSNCGHAEDASVMCLPQNTQVNVTLRLVGGTNRFQGRVEVLVYNIWGTVCDDNFTDQEATVTCRMAGFPNGGNVIRGTSFGGAKGPIWMDDVNCNGTETSLQQCVHNPWGVSNCGHGQDVAVQCNTSTLPNVQLRLAGSNQGNQGRVEVLYNNTWGTVCDDRWSAADAAVVCRQLGQPFSGAAPISLGSFGPGTGQILLDDVECIGTESSIAQCRNGGWGHSNCDHSRDAAVICQNSSVSSECEPFHALHHGNVDIANTTNGLIATLTCQVGYVLNGSYAVECDSNGKWNQTGQTCEIVECGPLPVPSHATVFSSDTKYGSTVITTCQNGYKLRGSNMSTCSGNGKWNNTDQLCIPVDCGIFPVVHNGNVTATNTIIGSTAKITCDIGYTLSGSSTSMCGVNGKWSSHNQSCTLVDCGSLPSPSHGTVLSMATTHGSTSTITCNTGYILHGSNTSICDQSGLWSSTGQKCTSVDCGTPIAPSNGNVASNSTSYGSVSTVSCNNGYFVKGNYTRVCGNNQGWTNENTTCLPIDSTILSAIIPGCLNHGWNIAVNLTFLRSSFPNYGDEMQIYLGNASCQGSERRGFLVYDNNFYECMTRKKVSANLNIFENQMVLIFDPETSAASNAFNSTIDLHCNVVDKNIVTSVSTNQLHSDANSISISVFIDPLFRVALPSNPLHAHIGDTVYVKVSSPIRDPEIKLLLKSCYIRPALEKDSRLDSALIQNGCEVESSIHMISISAHEIQFMFQNYAPGALREGMNVICDVAYCNSQELTLDCNQTCKRMLAPVLVG
ncbi:deleted in malignant brain tumors 1 protein-like isoform X1 [Dreissena polymorpha]|nr:deleted in malignant brain tumors 1 protein-like isoform X1 [Dreissena polymorpha]